MCSYSYRFVIVCLTAVQFLSVVFSENSIIQIMPINTTAEIFCPELFSTSLQIECFYEGNATSCDEPMQNGTIAKLKCKHSYYLDFVPFDELNCRNGLWNRPLYNCEPVCGKKVVKLTPFVINGKRAEVGDFPWQIGLYIKRKTKREHICGGSILSPKLVITAAHCFLKIDPRIYSVAAGKVNRDWDHEDDAYVQHRDVVDLIIEKKYKGAATGFTADMAILVLNQVFILSDLVQPICVDYLSTTFDTTEIKEGYIPGWGLTSEGGSSSDELLYATLPLRNRDDCLQIVPHDFVGQVTLDKVCAGYTNGTSVCEGDSGGGLVYPKMVNSTELRFFLIGVVSTGPFKEGSCDSYQYTTFTTAAAHIQWINRTKFLYETWSPYDYGCILPDFPTYGNYSIDADVPKGSELSPGSLAPQYARLQYLCNPGYRIHGKQIIKCKEKIWNENNFLPACFRTCTKLQSDDLEIEYVSENLNEPSDDEVFHETRALLRCKDSNYELEKPAYNQTTCRDGQWTRVLLKCRPICGTSNPDDDTKGNLTDASLRDYPWNAAVYENLPGRYRLRCAGSIISLFVVLVNSGCVKQNESSRYVVTAGSVTKDFGLTKTRQVSNIYRVFPYEYFDIIILKRRFNMTSFVRPACFRPTRIRLANSSAFEIPFWTSNEDNLRMVKYERKDMAFDILRNNNFTINVKASASGGLVVPVKQATETRYFIAGLGTVNEFENISIYSLEDPDLRFLSQILERNDILSFELNECVVPHSRQHVKSTDRSVRQGDIVLEGTKIKYTCDDYFDLYGTKEIICTNNSWNFSQGKPYCVGCGISRLNLNSSRFNTTQLHKTANPNKFPWHLTIYEVENGTQKFLCRGTLISSKLVLTQEFCIPGLNETIEYHELEHKYVVSAGNYNWNSSLDKYAQQSVVNKVLLPGLYLHLSVLVLMKPFHISHHVLPICMDVNRFTEKLKAPINGIMPYGDIERGKGNSSILNFIHVNQTMGHVTVFKDSLSTLGGNRLNCTSDEFWKIQKGSALVFQVKTVVGVRYYLRNLMRFGSCGGYSKLYFTNIYSYMNKILSYLNEYN